MKNLYNLLAVLTIIISISCGGDSDPSLNCITFDAKAISDLQLFEELAKTYSDDPSAVNCAALKTANQTAISSLERFSSCGDEVTKTIDELKVSLSVLPC